MLVLGAAVPCTVVSMDRYFFLFLCTEIKCTSVYFSVTVTLMQTHVDFTNPDENPTTWERPSGEHGTHSSRDSVNVQLSMLISLSDH